MTVIVNYEECNLDYKEEVVYLDWVAQSEETRKQLIQQFQEKPSPRMIVALSSWTTLPVPTLYEKEIQPQEQFFQEWDGVSSFTQVSTFNLTTNLGILMHEELIKPRRAYYLTLAEPLNIPNDPQMPDDARFSYIGILKWRNLLFICGRLLFETKPPGKYTADSSTTSS